MLTRQITKKPHLKKVLKGTKGKTYNKHKNRLQQELKSGVGLKWEQEPPWHLKVKGKKQTGQLLVRPHLTITKLKQLISGNVRQRL